MKELFPIEIVEYTKEKYWTKRNIKSQIIYISIVCLLLLGIIALPLIEIELSSQSRGTVRSTNEDNTLQSAISAEIKNIALHENKFVKAGDTLVWLRTDVIDEQINRLTDRLTENVVFMEDIGKLLSGNYSLISSPKYRAEYTQSSSRIRQQQVAFNQAKQEYTTSKELYAKGVESKHEYQQYEHKYDLTHSQLISITEELKSNWQTEQTRLELENRDLQSQLLRLEKDKTQYYIIAPISGNIVQYNGSKKGNFIAAGQSVAQIVSDDDLDAYDYRQWGLAKATVKEIVSDVTNLENQPFFRVRCAIHQKSLSLKNGHQGNIKKGMTLTGRFSLVERSLADLLFDKVDNWVNPKIVDNGN